MPNPSPPSPCDERPYFPSPHRQQDHLVPLRGRLLFVNGVSFPYLRGSPWVLSFWAPPADGSPRVILARSGFAPVIGVAEDRTRFPAFPPRPGFGRPDVSTLRRVRILESKEFLSLREPALFRFRGEVDLLPGFPHCNRHLFCQSLRFPPARLPPEARRLPSRTRPSLSVPFRLHFMLTASRGGPRSCWLFFQLTRSCPKDGAFSS